MERLQRVQVLRGLAAMLVVWAHAIDLVTVRELPAFQAGWGHLQNFGAVGVDVFFVISGFIITMTARTAPTIGHFVRARVLRIWPMYALATLAVAWGGLNADGSWQATLFSLGFIQRPGDPAAMPVHPLGWSLMYEVVFYALVALALAWRSPRVLAERIAILVIAVILLGAVLGHRQPMNVIGNPVALEFLAGVLIGHLRLSRPAWPSWLASAAFVLGASALLITALYGYSDISEAPDTLTGHLSWERVRLWGLPAALVVASAVLREEPAACWRPLVFLGDASYAIYLWSYVALQVLDRQWLRWAPASTDAAILDAAAMAVCFGVAMHVVLERPLAAWLRARFQSVSPGPSSPPRPHQAGTEG